MKTSAFDFPLPERLIASRPLERRDSSRLMVLRGDLAPEHRVFADLPDYLREGDMLVLNNTRVLPCRLWGLKRNGNPIHILLVRPIDAGLREWEVLSPGKYSGPVEISPRIRAELFKGARARLEYKGELRDILMEDGEMPLPHYIGRRAGRDDLNWYQTVYARHEGSVAAPTAGLHFTPELLATLEARGVRVRYLTLHVGPGTFIPLRGDALHEHNMLAESFEIPASLIEEIKTLDGRLVTVGTTATRALEGFLSGQYTPAATNNTDIISGYTDIFITPGYEFKAVRGLITNFHLPRSTPLALASAFCGLDRLLSAYRVAIDNSYRFFSYGDAMLLI